MRLPGRLDDRLDHAIDALMDTGRFDPAMVTDDELRDLLDTAATLRADAALRAQQSAIAAPRLARNTGQLRAAVQRARLMRGPQPPRRIPEPTVAWWRRPVSFASMSVPLGAVVAFGVIGVTGAAAGMAASDRLPLPAPVQDVVAAIDAPGIGSARPDHATPPERALAPALGLDGASETPVPNHTILTVSGIVANVRGGAFDLSVGADTWLIVTDTNTVTQGELANGATATVTGDVTGDRIIHATEVSVTIAALPVTDDDPPGQPGQPTQPAQQTTPAAPTATEAAPTETAVPEKTRTPGPPPRTPRGNGNDGSSEDEGAAGGGGGVQGGPSAGG